MNNFKVNKPNVSRAISKDLEIYDEEIQDNKTTKKSNLNKLDQNKIYKTSISPDDM